MALSQTSGGYENPAISWLAHTGTVNTDKDTMTMRKEWKGESSTWIFNRHPEADSFMSQLKSAIGITYQYTLPEQRNDGWGYGYKWMQVDLKYKGREIHSYFVPGDGGQILAVFPEQDMVMVFTAGTYGSDVKMACFNMIYRYILPAVLETP